mmetsp:Transcript_3833/g.8802  ORF Transcript_3833/g.8802 Transcript_3833/m.8802 type:complete len:209 (-) Transcript_3833:632-1258(-)
MPLLLLCCLLLLSTLMLDLLHHFSLKSTFFLKLACKPCIFFVPLALPSVCLFFLLSFPPLLLLLFLPQPLGLLLLFQFPPPSFGLLFLFLPLCLLAFLSSELRLLFFTSQPIGLFLLLLLSSPSRSIFLFVPQFFRLLFCSAPSFLTRPLIGLLFLAYFLQLFFEHPSCVLLLFSESRLLLILQCLIPRGFILLLGPAFLRLLFLQLV